jgi:hypothetical protein
MSVGERLDVAAARLSPRERVLLHHLRSCGAAIFAKQQTIADKLNLRPGKLKWSLRTVNRTMQKLIHDRKLVEVELRGPTSARYRLKKQEHTGNFGIASEKAEIVEQLAETSKLGVAFGVASAPVSLLVSEEEFKIESSKIHQYHRYFENEGHQNPNGEAASERNSSRKPKTSVPFVRSIAAAAGRKLSWGDLEYCAELERRGIDAETVCAGVLVGRARKFCSDSNRGIKDPIRTLRYFARCIEEAAEGEFPAGYAEYVRNWLNRHGQETRAPAEESSEVPASRALGFCRSTDRAGLMGAVGSVPVGHPIGNA